MESFCGGGTAFLAPSGPNPCRSATLRSPHADAHPHGLCIDEEFGPLSAGRGGPGMDRIRGALHARMPEMRRTDADLLLLGVTVERPQQPFGHLHRMRLSTTPRRRRQFRTPCFTDHAYCQPISGSAGGRCAVTRRGHQPSKTSLNQQRVCFFLFFSFNFV